MGKITIPDLCVVSCVNILKVFFFIWLISSSCENLTKSVVVEVYGIGLSYCESSDSKLLGFYFFWRKKFFLFLLWKNVSFSHVKLKLTVKKHQTDFLKAFWHSLFNLLYFEWKSIGYCQNEILVCRLQSYFIFTTCSVVSLSFFFVPHVVLIFYRNCFVLGFFYVTNGCFALHCDFCTLLFPLKLNVVICSCLSLSLSFYQVGC